MSVSGGWKQIIGITLIYLAICTAVWSNKVAYTITIYNTGTVFIKEYGYNNMTGNYNKSEYANNITNTTLLILHSLSSVVFDNVFGHR